MKRTLQSTKQNKTTKNNSWVEEGQRTSPKKQHSGDKGALEKQWKRTTTNENLVMECQRKVITGRIRRDRSNIKMLKRIEKRKQPASEITWPDAVTGGIFVKQVVFLTVNHCRPLPLRELHSTGETIVWRDPGGSWACLPPVYDYNHPATVCDTCGLRPEKAH